MLKSDTFFLEVINIPGTQPFVKSKRKALRGDSISAFGF